jgi:glucose-1-phosphate thymidylyltransferase
MASRLPSTTNFVGLLPAAGEGRRLGRLPGSKELLPVGFRRKEGRLEPVPVCVRVLEQMRQAGVASSFLVIREGKWDIPHYLGDGTVVDMRLGYLIRGRPYGPPYSLDQAYPFIRQALVAFGFPDILTRPADVYVRLRQRWEQTGADVVLGLYPAHRPEVMDMVELDADQRAVRLLLKPQRTELTHTWINALWAPGFTEFLHEHLGALPLPEYELTVGHVLQAAMEKGLRVDGVGFQDGAYLDIGTPEQFQGALRHPTLWGLE